MKETFDVATADWSKQLTDWVVANIDTPVAAAEKVYTQSENACEAD